MHLLRNTFGILQIQEKITNNIIKFIGDAIMIFIPSQELNTDNDSINNSYTLLEEIFAEIEILKMLHVDELYMKCKVSIHACTEVYNVTFFADYDDYYGKDIDLTARLLNKAKENSIIISDDFYQMVMADLNKLGKANNLGCLKNISGKYIEDFKGVPHSTAFWRLE